ncbi:MAG: glycine betaine/L-proline ABC transporter ATP-binding protein ProV [Pseudomonadales bacterium]
MIEGQHLNKIFGPQPQHALELIDTGLDKQTIFDRTGCSIGVRDASFTVDRGEVFVVMGLSGSGKSTLLRLINRLIEPTSGTVLIDGMDVTAMGKQELMQLRRERLTMVFQSFALMPHLRVWENAAFGLDVAGLPRRERYARACATLDMVGLGGHAHSRPDELSGGMQQRVGLARALACEPEILLMDEAFSALDPLIRADMQQELLDLCQAHELTVVFISHDLDEAMRIGDRIAIMDDGRILQVGTPLDILECPADEHVHRFFGGVDVSSVYTAEDLARADSAMLQAPRQGALAYAARTLRRLERNHGYVCDRARRFVGVISLDSVLDAMRRGESSLEGAYIDCEPLAPQTPFAEVVSRLAHASFSLPVVDDDGCLLGTVSRTILLETLERQGS